MHPTIHKALIVGHVASAGITAALAFDGVRQRVGDIGEFFAVFALLAACTAILLAFSGRRA